MQGEAALCRLSSRPIGRVRTSVSLRVPREGNAHDPRSDPPVQHQHIFTIAHIGGHTIAFTNASAYMLLTVAVVCLVGVRGFRGRQLVPGRFQSPAELSYVFVASMVRSTGGEEGMKFFPFVYSLFMFILVANVISIIPYTFSVTSQIIV